MRRKVFSLSISIAVVVMLTSAIAQRVGEAVAITEPQSSDQYLAGRVVQVSAPIGGDLVVAGRELVVDAQIDGDLIAAGLSLDLRDTVTDDVRAAGRMLTLDAQIMGHVVAAGQEVVLGSGASVADWAWLAGRTVTVEGQVGDQLRAVGQSVVLTGEIDGDAILAAERIEVGPGAIIRGDLRWASETEPDIAASATVEGEIIEEDLPEGLEGMRGFSQVGGIASAVLFGVALITAALAAFLVFPRFSQSAAGRIRAMPLRTLGLGLGVVVGTPIVILALFISRIGWIVGMATLVGYLLLLLCATLFGVIIVGALGLQLSTKEGTPKRPIQLLAIAIGVVLILLLAQIPVLGAIILLVVLLGGLGGISGELWQRYRQPAVP